MRNDDAASYGRERGTVSPARELVVMRRVSLSILALAVAGLLLGACDPRAEEEVGGGLRRSMRGDCDDYADVPGGYADGGADSRRFGDTGGVFR